MNPLPSELPIKPEVNYAKLRVSLELFKKPPSELSSEEYNQLLQRVNRELAVSKRVLETPESADVHILPEVVQQAVKELASRYDSVEQFDQALQDIDLDRDTLAQALEHELRVDATLEKVLSERAQVTDEEVEIYYYQHLHRFELPETRTARHILITLNPDFPENSREQVEKRMAVFKTSLESEAESFNSLAASHSECPTAMHEGLLGRIKPGQLYPELDTALFEMDEGQISDVLESPVGLHLLFCEDIHPAERLPFEQVSEKLREHLEMKKRKRVAQEWLQRKQ